MLPMRYIISYQNPHHHYIDIEFIIENINSDELILQLPAWRPGRYELGNFAKNIQKWAVYDAKGNPLKYRKMAKDTWVVQTNSVNEVHVKYNYYAADLNAGSTFLDKDQLYMNPVNCCLYVPGRIEEECSIEIKVPKEYKIATAMKRKSEHLFSLKNYHELADSPFIASNSLKHNMFILDGVEFNIWFQGECKPDWAKIINDFFIFINEQFVMMKEPTVDEYHFLFQILPHKFYHGVEHLNSTVIALWPSYKLMRDEDLYNDFLGVSSHELFHSWNIKAIRPMEMMPYDYTKENYSRLGYVCEGVTTYYGDLLLFRSGVYSEFEYFKTVYERLQKHFDNPGRFNLSVADSSFDTWLDGYGQGVPGRKTSIYDEGCLIAFITDMIIRKNTNNSKSLDDVMRYLYFEFAKKGKGYSEADYKGVVEHMANVSFDDFFAKYVNGVNPYEPILREMLDYIGCELKTSRSRKYYEAYYGIKLLENNPVAKISAVYPGSVADMAQLKVNDEIIAINGIQLKGDFAEWTKYFAGQNVDLMVVSNGYLKKRTLFPMKDEYYKIYYINKLKNASEEQKQAFNSWSRRKF